MAKRIMHPLLTLLSLALIGSPTCHASAPPIKVELRSSWPIPPFILEILETLSIENSGSFFPMINTLLDPKAYPLPEGTSSREVNQYVLGIALADGYLSEPGTLASFEMGLALHSALPKIEAAYQFYLDKYASKRVPGVNNCDSWVDWYGQVVCDVDSLENLVQHELIDPPMDVGQNHTVQPQPKLFPFDHILPDPKTTLQRPRRTAILYAEPTSPNFYALHSYLYNIARVRHPHVEYVFRHVPPRSYEKSTTRTHLSGYGVALDLKKMDYLALDDRRQGAWKEDDTITDTSERDSEVDLIAELLQQYPEDTHSNHSTPLTDEELQLLSAHAIQLISQSEEQLAALSQLSQNFPKYAASLARRVILEDGFLDKIASTHVKAPAGTGGVWLNGAVVQDSDMNPFSLLRLLRKERSVVRSVMSIGLNSSQAIELLTHQAIGAAQAESSVLDGLFDASDRIEGEGTILWWNDFETDLRYARWNPSVSTLLQPMYPGQLPNVRQNIFNIIAVADLSQSSTLSFIAGPVYTIMARGFAYRFGVVPTVETKASAQMARLFYWLMKKAGNAKTMEYARKISKLGVPMQAASPTVDWDFARSTFAELLIENVEDLGSDANVDFDSIIQGDVEGIDDAIEKAGKYARRLGADLASAPQGHVFFNGKHFQLDDDFLRAMQSEAAQQLQHLQEQLYYGNIPHDYGDRISTYFYDHPTVSKRRNKHLHPSGKDSLRILPHSELLGSTGFRDHGSYLYPDGLEHIFMTTFVVADLNSVSGLELVKGALASLMEETKTRVAFIHNPTSGVYEDADRPYVSSLLGKLTMSHKLSNISSNRLLEVLDLSTDLSPGEISQAVFIDETLGGALTSDAGLDVYDEFVHASQLFVRELKLQPGEQVVMVNGRIIGPIGPGEFGSEDIQDLITLEWRKRVEPVTFALNDLLGPYNEKDRYEFAYTATLASSLISSIHIPDSSESGLFNAPIRPRTKQYQKLATEYTRFTFGDSSAAWFHVGVFLDPLSEATQKWLPLLQWLLKNPVVHVEVILNPAKYKELPLKRFYKYNLLSEIAYDDHGEEMPSAVEFKGLPEDPIYTLAMDVAPSWLVRPREALYDLDNILLNVLSGVERTEGVRAIFSLDYLVIEGHARDTITNAPPRGLQLELTTSDSTPIADTLVVANLGYIQFRTKPGVYNLDIRPGRGREIYKVDSVGNEGWDSSSVDEAGKEVTLMSFEGLTLYPRVVRLPGMEGIDVLANSVVDHTKPESFLEKIKSSVSSLLGPKHTTDIVPIDNGQAEINIFTVASGLLYERFASIMILSVLRNTKSTVKFWFIENFLSPSFLEFIPHFAKAYNFQYELVTYKWPSWLRAQKEKQRIIWGYKILFLDVLFPMDLKKVIFVDADQIVRADLKELVDLDLHGAPYGYTPMGDDNAEMEGFRFWKTGYWKEFLQGMPYHISALYVVDLVRFRQMAAGDMLRGHYQQLSADPGSLANLDQDLPNNLQREVPIFSLPEDWLWCETWCSNDRLHRAKTIDLCQNPLTKEPKLERAKHIPEWEVYDGEIFKFTRELAARGTIHSGLAVADANVLADVAVLKSTKSSAIEEPTDSTAAARSKDEL